MHEQLAAKAPDRPEPRFELIRSRHSIAWSLAESSDPRRATPQYEVAIEELEQLIREHRDRTSYERTLADIYKDFAWLLATCSQPGVADAARAERLARKAIAIKPSNGRIHSTLGAASYFLGNWTAAVETLGKAIELKSDASATPFLLAMAHWKLGDRNRRRTGFNAA